MGLLDLPQELLDLVGYQLNAIDLGTVRSTSKRLYNVVGGDNALRQALIDLEIYWASESHMLSIMQHKDKESKGDRYPSYRKFLGRAACYTCLRISSPDNTARHDESCMRNGRGIFALPWAESGGIDRSQYDSVNLERQCIDCKIRTAEENGTLQRRHQTFAVTSWLKFRCRGCGVLVVLQRRDRCDFPRFEMSCQCEACFDEMNRGWTVFSLRLHDRVLRIQRYYEHLRLSRDRSIRYKGKGGVGPLPPSNDVREDAALWYPIFGNLKGFDTTKRQATLLQAMATMSRYMSWMSKVDAGKMCRHRPMEPPSMNGVLHLGPWPQWERVLQHTWETLPKWSGVICYREHKQMEDSA